MNQDTRQAALLKPLHFDPPDIHLSFKIQKILVRELEGLQLLSHAFSLPDEPIKGQLPWVTLHIQTAPSSRIQKYPRFLEGDNVAGTIDLNLLNPQTINTISVVVCCFTNPSLYNVEPQIFLYSSKVE
jgi:hypothetical protein